MTNQKARILINIKQNIDKQMNADYGSYWQNRTKVLGDIKNSDPKKFFKDINNLKGKGPNDQGGYLHYNNSNVTDSKEIADTFAQVWENIYKTNSPNPNNRFAGQKINEVNNWVDENQNLIQHHEVVNLNKLNKNNILTHPISTIGVKQKINKIK